LLESLTKIGLAIVFGLVFFICDKWAASYTERAASAHGIAATWMSLYTKATVLQDQLHVEIKYLTLAVEQVQQKAGDLFKQKMEADNLRLSNTDPDLFQMVKAEQKTEWGKGGKEETKLAAAHEVKDN
jgi:hypothetical protein